MAKTSKLKKPRPAARAMTGARIIEPKAIASPTHNQIAARAYAIWVAKGCPDGVDQSNWYEAETQLMLIG